MKRYVIPLTVIAIVALGLWGRQKISQSRAKAQQAAVQSLSNKNKNSIQTGMASSVANAQSSAIASASQNTLRPTDIKTSLNEMSLLLVDAVKGSKNLEGVIRRLKQTGQNPVVTRNGNPATGEMMIVRTKSPLPGTRYFHAQYFTDENNQRFVQHMSFEFKPGPTSMSDAVHAAVQNFSVGEPSERKADFMQWDLDDDYVLWIKKKSAKDLQNDPFNAHDPKADVGTVQMTVELKIHDDDHDHAH